MAQNANANASTDAGSTNQSDSHTNEDSNSARFNDSESEHGDDQVNGPQITLKYLADLFKKEWKLYYRTMHLNERLFLHCKGKSMSF